MEKFIIVNFKRLPVNCSLKPRFVWGEGGRRGRRQVSTALIPWATHTLQWRITMGRKRATSSKSHKFRLSSDWGLQPDPMKSESVVIADQQAAVNTFSGLVHTARQANKVGGGRTPEIWDAKASALTLKISETRSVLHSKQKFLG